MSRRSENSPTSEVFMWQPKVNGLVRDVPVGIVLHPDALKQEQDQLHLYGGLGEEMMATKRGVRRLGGLGLPSVGVVLQFNSLPADSVNIERTLVEAPLAVAREYNIRAGNREDRAVDLEGHSQGGGAALFAATRTPEAFGAVAAWSPVGLTPEAFGDTLEAKRAEFIKRLAIKNNLKIEQNPLLYPAILLGGYEVGKRAASDFIARDETTGQRRLYSKLAFGLSIDISEEVAELAQDHDVAVFAGKTDPVFEIDEYRASLSKVGAEDLIIEIPGSHTNLNTRASGKQMAPIADWLKDVRSRRQAA